MQVHMMAGKAARGRAWCNAGARGFVLACLDRGKVVDTGTGDGFGGDRQSWRRRSADGPGRDLLTAL